MQCLPLEIQIPVGAELQLIPAILITYEEFDSEILSFSRERVDFQTVPREYLYLRGR